MDIGYKRLLVAALVLLGITGLSEGPLIPEASAQGWEAQGDRTQEIIARYKRMLEENPVEGMALERLLGHVGRGTGLDQLIAEYERKLASRPDSINFRLILGHLHKAKGEMEKAKEYYNQVVERRPADPLGWLGQGTILLLEGERRRAMEDFEEALTRETNRERRRELLRQLGELSFGQREFERGKDFYERLIQMTPNDQFVRMDYVRLLVQHRQFEDALAQYDRLLQLAGRDNPRRAQVLRDRAEVYEMMDDLDRAVATYEQVLAMVSSTSWIAMEVRHNLVSLYRRAGRLTDFLTKYEASWRRGGVEQQIIVADVYTEVGRLEEGLTLYRQIANRNRSDVESRRKVIRVLERLGREQEIVAAHEDLIRAAPARQQFGFDLASHHMRQGDRDRARQVLQTLSTRFRANAYVLLEIAEHYARWNFDEEARQTYEVVLSREGDDDAVLIEVGDFFFDRGERERAIEIWSRLPQSQLGNQRGKERLAEIFVDRGITAQGISLFEELLRSNPNDERLLRAFARGLERARRFEDAREAWERVLAVSTQRQRRQEARARIVELHQRQNTLRGAMRAWSQQRLSGEEGALDAAFFLVEAHLRLREFSEAENLLSGLVEEEELTSDDRASILLLLEQTYVRSGRYEQAITVLRQLIALRPDMERDLLDRMADHALEAQSADEAVGYARELLDANPNDARAQARMGDIQRRAGRLEEAARYYGTAVDIDHRAYDVQLKLGETLLALDRISEGQRALLQVVQNAPDEQLVQDAGRILLAMAKREGRLASLEMQFSPLIFRLPVQPVHARLVMDLYEALAGPLLLELYHGSGAQRETARAYLYQVGGRATALLVDQLQSRDRSQQVRALRLIGEMNVDAAAPQVARLVGAGEDRIRKMAIVTAARLGDPLFVDPLESAMREGAADLRHLSIWALGNIQSPQAVRILREQATGGLEGTATRLAWIGLGKQSSPDVEILIARNLESILAGEMQATQADLAIILAAAGARVGQGGGVSLRPHLENLMVQRSDRSAALAATVLSLYDEDRAHEFLWAQVFHGNRSAARAAEEGLAGNYLHRSSGHPVESEAFFFNWNSGEFRTPGLIRLRERGAIMTTRQVPDSQEPSLRGLHQGLGSLQLGTLFERIGDDREGSFWSERRREAVARALLEQGDLPQGARKALFALAGDHDFSIDRQDSTGALSTEDLRLVLMATSLGTQVKYSSVEAIFTTAIGHEDQGIQRLALIALRSLQKGDELREVEEFVVNALQSRSAGMQLEAVRTVGALQIHRAEPLLRSMEPHASPALRRAIRQAYRELPQEGENRGPVRTSLDPEANSF